MPNIQLSEIEDKLEKLKRELQNLKIIKSELKGSTENYGKFRVAIDSCKSALTDYKNRLGKISASSDDQRTKELVKRLTKELEEYKTKLELCKINKKKLLYGDGFDKLFPSVGKKVADKKVADCVAMYNQLLENPMGQNQKSLKAFLLRIEQIIEELKKFKKLITKRVNLLKSKKSVDLIPSIEEVEQLTVAINAQIPYLKKKGEGATFEWLKEFACDCCWPAVSGVVYTASGMVFAYIVNSIYSS